MAIKCPKCQYDNPETQKFCGDCGTQLPSIHDIAFTETLEAPIKQLATGSIFAGRYQIIEELGEGGMGRVYRVLDKKLNEEVALKLIKPEIALDKKTIERFSNELKLARKISHRNIGRMFELMEEKGLHFITMEYVPGEDLRSFLHRSKHLTIGTAVAIAKEVCEGLAEAHRLGIIHRDLKPSNIIIDKEGNARIMDFGIARSLKSKSITGAGAMIGTPEYMSPEQVEGKEVDQRSDIYSLGVILYEMLTGRVPFEGDTPFTIGVKHKSEIPKNPKELNTQIPDDLSKLILRCLEKDKAKRYRTAEELITELTRIEKGIPTTERAAPKRKPFTSRQITVTFGAKKLLIPVLGVIVIVLVALAIWRFLPKKQVAPPPANKRIVVLPFENLGAPEDEYFAEGITDEITARIASINQLEVIGRSSAVQYKKTDKSARKIGEELGVNYILYGTVRWQRQAGGVSKVRVTPSLVRVADATQIWANSYDETIAEVFQVQSDIAMRVAEALNVALLEPMKKNLEAKLTNSPAAYDFYLRGMDYYNRGSDSRNNITLSIEMFEKAIQLDPNFIQAYSGLARGHALMYWYHFDHTEERASKCKQAADEALELGPNLPETHLALAVYYYQCKLNYEGALEQLSFALEKQPKNTEVLQYIAYVKRRQGKLDEHAVYLKKALEIDPRSVEITRNLGDTYFLMRKYIEGERLYKLAISFSPDYVAPYISPSASLAFLYLSWDGSARKVREVLKEVSKRISSPDDENEAHFLGCVIDIYEKDFQSALKHVSSMSLEALDSQFLFVPKNQLYAQIYGLMKNKEKELEYYDLDRTYLEKRIKAQPDDSRFHSALGIAYAGLGLKAEAVQEAEKATEFLPISKDYWRGTLRVQDLAQVYVMVGKYDKALDKIEYLLSIPGELSVALLKIDPVWAPLRSLPRFSALVRKFGVEK